MKKSDSCRKNSYSQFLTFVLIKFSLVEVGGGDDNFLSRGDLSWEGGIIPPPLIQTDRQRDSLLLYCKSHVRLARGKIIFEDRQALIA